MDRSFQKPKDNIPPKMTRQRMSHHRAYECFQRKMECTKCGILLVFKDQKVGMHWESITAKL